MSKLQKIILTTLMLGILAVIILTWGSIGSAVLTLALLLAGGYLLLNQFMETHNPDDYHMEN